MISDASAAGDWPVAAQALDLVGEAAPDDDDVEHVARRATWRSSPTSG